MRSGLQSVAISCNESDDHRPFAAFSDVRAPSESGFDASNALRTLILCKKTNFAELAFYEVQRTDLLMNPAKHGCRSPGKEAPAQFRIRSICTVSSGRRRLRKAQSFPPTPDSRGIQRR